MPLIQYSHPQRGINKTIAMASPRNISNLGAWRRAACKAIPEMPTDGWEIYGDPLITEWSIVFCMYHVKTKERYSLVIDRRRSSIGG